MKQSIIILLFIVTFHLPVQARDQVVPFTLADRDRIIRTEIKLEALETKMDAKFAAVDAKFAAVDTKFAAVDTKIAAVDTKIEALNSRIDYIFWTLGLLVSLMLFMFGYMIWDRRTALRPALEKAQIAESLSSTNTRVLRDYAKEQPGLAEILKRHGLL